MVPFSQNGQYQANCNMCDWFNQGTTNVRINQRLLLPKTGFAVIAFPGEVDRTNYVIDFETPNVQGNQLLLTVKKYV